MRLEVPLGHAGRLTSPTASTGQHCAANSLPHHRPISVDQHQLTDTVQPTPRMASVRDPLIILSVWMGWKTRTTHDAHTYAAAANRTPVRRRCHHDLQGQRDPREEGDGTPPGALFLFLFSLFSSLGLWYHVLPAWSIKGKVGHRSERERD